VRRRRRLLWAVSLFFLAASVVAYVFTSNAGDRSEIAKSAPTSFFVGDLLPKTTVVPPVSKSIPLAVPKLVSIVAETTGKSQRVMVVSTSFKPILVSNEQVTISGTGFPPGATVQLVISSTPQLIWTGVADSQGTVSVTGTFPTNIAPGSYTLSVIGHESTISQPITIVAPIVNDSTTATVPGTASTVPHTHSVPRTTRTVPRTTTTTVPTTTTTVPTTTTTVPTTTTTVPTTTTTTVPTATATQLALTRASVGTASGAAFTIQPQVTVRDADGNTVTGLVTITATITTGAGGTLVGTTSTTSASGVGTFVSLGINGVATTAYTITYSSGALTVATQVVTASVGTATQLALTRASDGTASGAAFTTQPQVTVRDTGGNTVTTDSSTVITATISSGALIGTVTATALSGIATFVGLGIDGTVGTAYTITYSSGALTVATQVVTASVGTATQLALTRASVGTADNVAFTTQPQVTVRDSGGNTVTTDSSTVITATITAGAGGTLIGTNPATASSGIATFIGLGIDGTVGTAYTITYSSGALTVATQSVTTTSNCATGGTCVVGDTGPGGGIVFYVQAAGGVFTSIGSDCNTACKYLEAVPADQSTGIVWATTAAFCYPDNSSTGNQNCQTNSIYSGLTAAQSASRTAATAIGAGMANTNQIYARVTTASAVANTTLYASGIAFDYAYNGKTDWHLPSKGELNELCKYARQQTTGDTATVCTSSGTFRSGFAIALYWSSSENNALNAWNQNFNNGNQLSFNKYNTFYVRPVRAF